MLYNRSPDRFSKVDAGDLSKAKLLKKNLNCKPFQYMLEFIMPDMLERYPIADRGVFCKGAIQSEADPKLCVDTVDNTKNTLNNCSKNLEKPSYNQDFVFSWHRQIRRNSMLEKCLSESEARMDGCHFFIPSDQFWRYDLVSFIHDVKSVNFQFSSFCRRHIR